MVEVSGVLLQISVRNDSHAWLISSRKLYSFPRGESVLRKLTTALLEKVFFPNAFLYIFTSLSASLKWHLSLLYQSKPSFFSNHFAVYRYPFYLLSFSRDRLSLQKCCNASLHCTPAGFQWLAFLCVSSHICKVISLSSSEIMCNSPLAPLKTHLWVPKEGDSS